MFKYSFNERANCMPFQQNDTIVQMFMVQNTPSNTDVIWIINIKSHSKCSIDVGCNVNDGECIPIISFQNSKIFSIYLVENAAPHIRHHLNHFERTHSFPVETADSFCQNVHRCVCQCVRVVCII